MRDIKFRAWDIYNKKIVELFDLEHIYLAERSGQSLDFANYKIMQFTGLYDKNKKPIYEGDIIMVCNSDNDTGYLRFKNYEVEFHYGSFKIVHERYEGQVSAFEILEEYVCPVTGNSYMEIMGNVYENPELLK